MKNRTKLYLSSVLSVTAVILAMSILYYFTFPPEIISFPTEITKVVHNANNGTATITYKWLGENERDEYGHHILVFRCPDAVRQEQELDKATFQYLFVHYGEILEVNIPNQGWFVEMHDGDHLAIEVLADGTRQLARKPNGEFTK